MTTKILAKSYICFDASAKWS